MIYQRCHYVNVKPKKKEQVKATYSGCEVSLESQIFFQDHELHQGRCTILVFFTSYQLTSSLWLLERIVVFFHDYFLFTVTKSLTS
jgi:hypothetical protein